MNTFSNIKPSNFFASTSGGFDEKTMEIFDKIKELNINRNFDINNYFGNQKEAFSRVVNKKTLEEILFDARAQVKIETSKVSMHLDSKKIEKLFYQIDTMHDPEEWGAESSAIEVSSYRSFLSWYLLVKPERGAGLGLSSSGNLIAAWMKNKDRLVLEFMLDGKVKWFISKKIEGDLETASGLSTIKRLSDVLIPYDVNAVFFKRAE